MVASPCVRARSGLCWMWRIGAAGVSIVVEQITKPVEERISWFPLEAEEDLTPEVRALFTKVQERFGFVPNVFRAYAWRPERLLKWRAHYDDLMRGSETLSATEREMIAVAVSMRNGCLYCLTS